MDDKVPIYFALAIMIIVGCWWGYYLFSKFRNFKKWYWQLSKLLLFVFSCFMFPYYALYILSLYFPYLEGLSTNKFFLLWHVCLLSYVALWLVLISRFDWFINRKKVTD
jgi:hypothetical protein